MVIMHCKFKSCFNDSVKTLDWLSLCDCMCRNFPNDNRLYTLSYMDASIDDEIFLLANQGTLRYYHHHAP